MSRTACARLFLAQALSVLCLIAIPRNVFPQTTPDWPKNFAEALKNLQELVKIDTSNPPGNETRLAQHLKAILDKEGIPAEIVSSDANRGNLIARLKGNGKKRPLLLAGHSDVVGVEREKWTVDPFAGLIKDGHVYGRGVYDDKDNLAAALQVVLMLHRMKVPLDRDIILLSESGEEGGGGVGMGFLVNQHWDKIDSEFALLEGGETLLDATGKIMSFGVATTEKVPNGMRLVAKGTSGHGSIPRPDNPIVHLAAAVAKVGEFQPPMRLNDTTRAYFQRLATISSPEDAFMYTHLEDPVLGPAIQEKLRTTKLTLNSMLRTSISPNLIKGGFRSNVIPGDAEATLDVRALPDEDIGEFVATLRRIINDPAVEVIPPAGGGRPKSVPSRLDSEMFRALEKAQAAVLPGAVTLPMMVTGATDGAQLRAKGVQVYGLGSVNLGLLHGNDERIPVEGFNKFLEIMYRAVVEVAAAK
jgi:acetylornithine deacetylase/succinyl-diaminopimelate desuccinylase-like protein